MFVKKKKSRKIPEGEGAPAPEKPSLSHFQYGNTTELGAADQFVTSHLFRLIWECEACVFQTGSID